MTAKEFAKAINRPYPTVALWLRSNLIPEATSIQLGDMRVWQIPRSVLATFKPPKIGRPSKKSKADGQVSTATGAPDDGAPSAAIGERKRAKPAKKAPSKGSKKSRTR